MSWASDVVSVPPTACRLANVCRSPYGTTRPSSPHAFASRRNRSRRVKRVYRSFEMPQDQTPEEVLVDPYHIANLQGEWYVLGVYSGHDDVYQLALPRVSSAALTDQHFDVLAGFDARQLLAGTFGRFIGDGTSHRVRLLFDKEVARWVTERQWHPSQQIRTRKNGAVELDFPAAGLFEVQRWVLSWGSQVRVLAPVELKRNVADQIRQMAARLNTGLPRD